MENSSKLALNINRIEAELAYKTAQLVAVSKTKPIGIIQNAYDLGVKDFGENKVQELMLKYNSLPKDIHWHMIGHLQTNKVKYIAPFVSLIHTIDSLKLLLEINKRALQNQRIINCLFQIRIAREESKFGLSASGLEIILNNEQFLSCKNIHMKGLMGMASNACDKDMVKSEFATLSTLFTEVRKKYGNLPNLHFTKLSMGMTNDYKIALEAGSNMIRIGSLIFGERIKRD